MATDTPLPALNIILSLSLIFGLVDNSFNKRGDRCKNAIGKRTEERRNNDCQKNEFGHRLVHLSCDVTTNKSKAINSLHIQRHNMATITRDGQIFNLLLFPLLFPLFIIFEKDALRSHEMGSVVDGGNICGGGMFAVVVFVAFVVFPAAVDGVDVGGNGGGGCLAKTPSAVPFRRELFCLKAAARRDTRFSLIVEQEQEEHEQEEQEEDQR
eukprot:m.59712 g.59712  ORF g.59712 m.59712 type:complete len:211 (-) comp11329_c2_seq1:37-669(-)